jgi:hypothetical protein
MLCAHWESRSKSLLMTFADAQEAELTAEAWQLRQQLATQEQQWPKLSDFAIVQYPLEASKAGFDAVALQDLAALASAPVPLLHVADHELVKAVEARMSQRYFGVSSPQDDFGMELTPLMSVQSWLELLADVRAAPALAQGGDQNLNAFVAAVHTAAYLTTWGKKLVAGRLGGAAAYLQFDVDAAHKWAVHSYEAQNTMLGDAAAAVAFALAEATDAQPPTAHSPQQPVRGQLQGTSGGRCKGCTGGSREGWNTSTAEQVSGPGANRAPARAQ